MLPKVESKNKPAVTALREIAAGKVGIEMLKKVPGCISLPPPPRKKHRLPVLFLWIKSPGNSARYIKGMKAVMNNSTRGRSSTG